MKTRCFRGRKLIYLVLIVVTTVITFGKIKSNIKLRTTDSSHKSYSVGKRAEIDSVYVVGISDGDTFKALTKDKEQIKCRIYGIDAPEMKQAFGDKSKGKLAEKIFNKKVEIVLQSTDVYKRKVVWVYFKGEDIGLQMIKEGFAWHYKKYFDSEEYAEAQKEASMKKVGLWADKNPTSPWLWREEQKNNRKK